MADKIYIKGNFFIAEDEISKSIYFKVKKSDVFHLRNSDDNFSFFYVLPYADISGTKFLMLGQTQDWNNRIQLKRTVYNFNEIVDEFGLPYLDADFLDEYLNDNLGASGGCNVVVNGKHSELILDDGTNPHGTTQSDVGLGNVDNTSDLDKPISNATQLAINDKLETVATDVTIIGDGTIGNPLSVVADASNFKNFASTQWETSASSVTLSNGVIANGFTFFVPGDKIASGTTIWDEYNLAFGIDLTISGTNGSIVINFGAVTGTEFSETLTFLGTLDATVEQWVIDNKALALSNGSARILYNGGSTIRFCSSEAVCNSVATTSPTGDMTSVRINPFTGLNASAIDHVLIPYEGEPYEGLRLQHKFRVNFGIQTGSVQTLALSLRRFEDDSIIGSEMKVTRDQDVEGNQFNFLTYTSGVTDPFVQGGFYFALRNNSGASVNINGAVGIYIETTYEKPIIF